MGELTRKRQQGWVQTEREAHEAWAALMRQSPRAAELMHLLVARVGKHNAVVISQKTLAKLMKRHVNTVTKAVKDLAAAKWIDVRQIGDRGTLNAYIINDRVAWSGKRDGIRYSLFTATVIVSDEEQPDRDQLDTLEPLRQVPSLLQGEMQLPVGDGMPPPSQPAIPGFEPDLPSVVEDQEETTEERETDADAILKAEGWIKRGGRWLPPPSD